MYIFTKEEKDFMDKNGLTEEDIYDGRGESRKSCHDHAKANNCKYYFSSSPCRKSGHRIRTRCGHCAICNPGAIAFQDRHSGSGGIYVATNGDYTKVGVVDNNINNIEQAIHNRELRLNIYGGYGSEDNWKIIAWAAVDQNVGMIEHAVHNMLSDYSVKAGYYYGNGYKEAQEMFSCDSGIAFEAIDSYLSPKWSFA